jgi:hypothetical protein
MRSKCARLLATIVRELDVAVRKTAMTTVSYPSWSTLDDGSPASQTEDVLSGSIKECQVPATGSVWDRMRKALAFAFLCSAAMREWHGHADMRDLDAPGTETMQHAEDRPEK